MRNGWKERARIAVGISGIALASSPSLATVMEFDEAGRVTVKPAINYLQRARLANEANAEQPQNFATPHIEHIVNNTSLTNDQGTSPGRAQSTPTIVASLPDISALPAAAFTYVEAIPSSKALAPLKARVLEIAEAHAIPLELFVAMIDAESGFDPKAISPKGAIGLAQLMPATAKSLGVDPTDPEQNLLGGARYLRQQFERFGTWPLALAAYNAGPSRVARLGRIPNIPETKTFVARVMKASGLGSNPIAKLSN